MDRRIIISAIFILMVIKLNAQYSEIKISEHDTIFEYFDSGIIKAWYFDDNTSISFMNILDKGIYHKIYGQYILIDGTKEIMKVGTWKWFMNNGTLKDSVIYKNGAELFRARFNNDGTLQFENNSGFLVETNKIVEKCGGEFIIMFRKRNMTVLESMILPTYQEHGFYIIKNGVYDFVVNGKKYFQAVVLDVNEDGFLISKDWNFDNGVQIMTDSTFINIKSNIQIRLLSINNGVGGFPTRTKNGDYDIQILKSDKYCKFVNAEFMSKDGKSIGKYYFTQYGLKNLKMKNGKPYLCEETGDYALRRR
jgi:hypothetical protein